VPWCEECSRYFTPNSVNEDGTCPTCGDTIQLPEHDAGDEQRSDEKAPWHFKLMVVAVTVYLGWRLVELIQQVA
jgi:PHP family Zn ribbon phosphoesterase